VQHASSVESCKRHDVLIISPGLRKTQPCWVWTGKLLLAVIMLKSIRVKPLEILLS